MHCGVIAVTIKLYSAEPRVYLHSQFNEFCVKQTSRVTRLRVPLTVARSQPENFIDILHSRRAMNQKGQGTMIFASEQNSWNNVFMRSIMCIEKQLHSS